ncbi:hypothetical protein IWT140_00566 [Secundilactobacillus pentosiphilus]|uniref:Uncharacterized protein n=1 Tax=Secundilactobacillus pentosiphilus TaxID=1714682 RepID=A0A1Z5IMV0_9LACO|nr:hypothetical protein [Secundilactobacillus pentosiphilus]GAX02968.1 hypothetical protein IWT140_00566 [Secundilactobacillus pentosiphilus]
MDPLITVRKIVNQRQNYETGYSFVNNPEVYPYGLPIVECMNRGLSRELLGIDGFYDLFQADVTAYRNVKRRDFYRDQAIIHLTGNGIETFDEFLTHFKMRKTMVQDLMYYASDYYWFSRNEDHGIYTDRKLLNRSDHFWQTVAQVKPLGCAPIKKEIIYLDTLNAIITTFANNQWTWRNQGIDVQQQLRHRLDLIYKYNSNLTPALKSKYLINLLDEANEFELKEHYQIIAPE